MNGLNNLLVLAANIQKIPLKAKRIGKKVALSGNFNILKAKKVLQEYNFYSFTLLTHGGMYEDLKQLLGREVDLVVDGSLRPYAQESVERDKILVYERGMVFA